MKKIIFICIAITGFTFTTHAQYVVPNFTSTPPSHYSSSDNDNQQRIDNISATVGFHDEWSFRFYSNGTFDCREWTGYHGKWDTKYMKNITYRSGTYYITQNEYGSKIVHLRYSNGNQKTGSLRYESGRLIFSFERMAHKEIL